MCQSFVERMFLYKLVYETYKQLLSVVYSWKKCRQRMTQDANGFFTLELPNEDRVHFFCLIPVYTKEMDFKLKKGGDALIEKLEKAGVNEIVDVRRKSVNKGSFWIF